MEDKLENSKLSKDRLNKVNGGINIDESNCVHCGLCVNACQYDALTVYFDDWFINEGKCIGCGECIYACPTQCLSF